MTVGLVPLLNLHTTRVLSVGKKGALVLRKENAKPASACRYSGIKFTMLPQPDLDRVEHFSNKTPPSSRWAMKSIARSMRKASPHLKKHIVQDYVPSDMLESKWEKLGSLSHCISFLQPWNIDWALLDETYPSAAEKIRRGFHNIRLVCHPNHFRLLQESGSFNFVNVYGTVRHDLVIAAKINFTRVTNQTFLGTNNILTCVR